MAGAGAGAEVGAGPTGALDSGNRLWAVSEEISGIAQAVKGSPGAG
jgi:hypothetical protein